MKDETDDGEQSKCVWTVRQTSSYSFSRDDGYTTEVKRQTDRSKGQGIKARDEAN